MHGDFESVPLRADDFVYADPPYDVEFTQYSKEVFGWDEQVRTAEWLAKHKGPVILSNQATDNIVAALRTARIRPILSRRAPAYQLHGRPNPSKRSSSVETRRTKLQAGSCVGGIEDEH